MQRFLDRVLERADLATVGPEKGRFRTSLLVSLRNHVFRQAERQSALKRGGSRTHVSVHTDGAARGDYLTAGVRLGMAEGTLAVMVHRLRLRLQELIRSEIVNNMVASPEEADEEMRYLLER